MSVKWQWKGDKGYVDYDADMVRKLEKAVVDDKDEVKVDSDRFVDVHNKLQRRYDDRSKVQNLFFFFAAQKEFLII